MELTGIVQNGVVVPDNGKPLPEGARVRILIESQETTHSAAKELLMKFAGCMTGLPADMARNHDHYIHGIPKQ
ncbi:MAG TPA: hypothetical protein VMF69_03375 [Gemmataceae bacterium]|nr:hypothetical protein [Gemmataceae bacterium]